MKVRVIGQRPGSPGQKMIFRVGYFLMTLALEMPRKQLRNMTVQIRRRVFSKGMWFFFYKGCHPKFDEIPYFLSTKDYVSGWG